jgi:hypothetical protein
MTTVAQFGNDYLGVMRGPLTLDFQGDTDVSLTDAAPASGTGMWWSKRGDDSESTLTRAFDLTGVQKATLQFSTRFEIELNYDYAFVTVSTDGGKTWTTLPGSTTTNDDPQGANYGNGITGLSGEPGVDPESGLRGKWLEESMDLSPFAGKQILVRFWLVHDAALNYTGLLLDNIRIPEIGYSDDVESGDGGWEAQGFVRTTGALPQEWTLRLVQISGDKTTVTPVLVDAQGHASVSLPDGTRGVLMVSGTTYATTEPANYSYTIK